MVGQEFVDKTMKDQNDEPVIMGAGMDNTFRQIMERIDACETLRKQLMPTERDALFLMLQVHQRLKEFGWNDAIYAPIDRRPLELIEFGSTGIHKGFCEERPSCNFPRKWFWILDDDTWPSKPVLYRLPKEDANT